MATAKERLEVHWQEDERVDEPDLTATQTLARMRTQDGVQFLANRAPRAGHTGRTWMPYSVWALNGSGVTFDPAISSRIRIAAGLRLVLTGGDGGDAGDVIELDSEAILNNFCPDVGTPLRLLMARINVALLAKTNADRVFYKVADETEEVRNVTTQKARQIEWSWVDSTNAAAITAAEALGYQWVATLDFNGGLHQVDEWHYILPETEAGAGSVAEGVAGVAWGLVRAVEAMLGPGFHWTATPDNTLKNDEFHADNFWAMVEYIVGTKTPGSTATKRAGLLPSTVGAKVGFTLEAAPIGQAMSSAVNFLLDGYRLADRTIFRFIGPQGDLFELTAAKFVDLVLGGTLHWMLRARKDASGRRLLVWRDGVGDTDLIGLRDDRRLEMMTATRVVRMLPIELAIPGPPRPAAPVDVVITHDPAPVAGVGIDVQPTGVGDQANLCTAAGGVLLDSQNGWVRVVASAAGTAVYCDKMAGLGETLIADLAALTGGRDVYIEFSTGRRFYIYHNAGIPGGFARVYFNGNALLADLGAMDSAVGQLSDVTRRITRWYWDPVAVRWEFMEQRVGPTADVAEDVLRLPIVRTFAGIAGPKNETLVSVTADCQNTSTSRLRMRIYEGTDSVGTDGAGNDYAEWLSTESGEKTLDVDPALLDADGTLSRVAVEWQIWGGGPGVELYVKDARASFDVVTIPK